MGKINLIPTKTEFIKIIKNQREILIENDFSPRALRKDVKFKEQAKLIEDTTKFFFKDIKPPKYNFISIRSLTIRISLYFIAFLLFINIMFNSFFAKSWYNNGWSRFSDLQYFIMRINTIILILFIISFIVFFIYSRLSLEKISKSSKDFRAVFKYDEFLIDLEKKVKSPS